MSSKKKTSGIVYSTNPDFKYSIEEETQTATLPPEKQLLKVNLEKKHRGGKVVTIVSGFIGREEDLNNLGKLLKTKCGVGGSVKNGDIIIQGENNSKIISILMALNYRLKSSK